MSSSEIHDTPATPKQAQPTEKQLSFLGIIMQNIQGKPEIDWEAVAKQADHKTAAVSKETYRQLQKKLGWVGSSGSVASKSGGTASKSSGASKTSSTPTKVVKHTGKVGSKAPGITGPKSRGKKATKQAPEEVDGVGDYVNHRHKGEEEDDVSEGV